MRRLFAAALAFGCAVSAQAQTDINSWQVAGRVAYITETTYPDANKIVSVTLGNIDHERDGNFSRYITFNCTDYVDCSLYILGTCTKQTSIATTTSTEGVTTFKVSYCLNQHYADGWTFSGFMTPQLWATGQVRNNGCNF